MSLAGTLTGLFKEAYAKELENLIPEAAKNTKMISFIPSDRENGKTYNQPVVVAAEQGFTYALDGAGIYTLNDAIGLTLQNASVPGNDLVLSSAVAYNDAARASNSKKAFMTTMGLKLENMMESAVKRLEIAILHGQSGLGLTSSITAAVSPTADSSTVVLSAASWATGIWAGMEGAVVQFYNGSSLVSSGADSLFSVYSVDPSTYTLVVSGTATGSAAIEALTATPLDIYFNGAKANEMAGLRKIITNTGSLFGIDAGVYNLWKGNSVTVSGQLTMGKVLSAVSKAVQRGLNEKVVLEVNPDTWANLASDLAALRMFDGSYSKKEAANGSEDLVYYGQNGEIKIVSYNIVKQGEAFIFPPDRCQRIGAQDLSFNTPGKSEEEIFFQLPTQAGVGLRAYTNQAIFLETPARAVYISGITNSAA